jgi:hypothetical protein
METQFWIIGQIAIDVFMLILLAGVLRFHLRQRVSLDRFETAAQESQSLLAEMRQISSALEQNLGEKKSLTRHLLEEFDNRVTRAEKASFELEEVLKIYSHRYRSTEISGNLAGPKKESIEALLDKGLSKEDISKHLGVPVGELELILKLQSSPDKDHPE